MNADKSSHSLPKICVEKRSYFDIDNQSRVHEETHCRQPVSRINDE
jgi:hypothetical protein